MKRQSTDLQGVRKALDKAIIAANKVWMATHEVCGNISGQSAVDTLEDFSDKENG